MTISSWTATICNYTPDQREDLVSFTIPLDKGQIFSREVVSYTDGLPTYGSWRNTQRELSVYGTGRAGVSQANPDWVQYEPLMCESSHEPECYDDGSLKYVQVTFPVLLPAGVAQASRGDNLNFEWYSELEVTIVFQTHATGHVHTEHADVTAGLAATDIDLVSQWGTGVLNLMQSPDHEGTMVPRREVFAAYGPDPTMAWRRTYVVQSRTIPADWTVDPSLWCEAFYTVYDGSLAIGRSVECNLSQGCSRYTYLTDPDNRVPRNALGISTPIYWRINGPDAQAVSFWDSLHHQPVWPGSASPMRAGPGGSTEWCAIDPDDWTQRDQTGVNAASHTLAWWQARRSCMEEGAGFPMRFVFRYDGGGATALEVDTFDAAARDQVWGLPHWQDHYQYGLFGDIQPQTINRLFGDDDAAAYEQACNHTNTFLEANTRIDGEALAKRDWFARAVAGMKYGVAAGGISTYGYMKCRANVCPNKANPDLRMMRLSALMHEHFPIDIRMRDGTKWIAGEHWRTLPAYVGPALPAPESELRTLRYGLYQGMTNIYNPNLSWAHGLRPHGEYDGRTIAFAGYLAEIPQATAEIPGYCMPIALWRLAGTAGWSFQGFGGRLEYVARIDPDRNTPELDLAHIDLNGLWWYVFLTGDRYVRWQMEGWKNYALASCPFTEGGQPFIQSNSSGNQSGHNKTRDEARLAGLHAMLTRLGGYDDELRRVITSHVTGVVQPEAYGRADTLANFGVAAPTDIPDAVGVNDYPNYTPFPYEPPYPVVAPWQMVYRTTYQRILLDVYGGFLTRAGVADMLDFLENYTEEIELYVLQHGFTKNRIPSAEAAAAYQIFMGPTHRPAVYFVAACPQAVVSSSNFGRTPPPGLPQGFGTWLTDAQLTPAFALPVVEDEWVSTPPGYVLWNKLFAPYQYLSATATMMNSIVSIVKNRVGTFEQQLAAATLYNEERDAMAADTPTFFDGATVAGQHDTSKNDDLSTYGQYGWGNSDGNEATAWANWITFREVMETLAPDETPKVAFESSFGLHSFVPGWASRGAFVSRDAARDAMEDQAEDDFLYHVTQGQNVTWPARDPLRRPVDRTIGPAAGQMLAATGCRDLRALELTCYEIAASVPLALLEDDGALLDTSRHATADSIAVLGDQAIPFLHGLPGLGTDDALTLEDGRAVTQSSWGMERVDREETAGVELGLGSRGSRSDTWRATDLPAGWLPEDVTGDVAVFLAYTQLTGDAWALEQWDGLEMQLLHSLPGQADAAALEFYVRSMSGEPELDLESNPFARSAATEAALINLASACYRVCGTQRIVDAFVAHQRGLAAFAAISQQRRRSLGDPGRVDALGRHEDVPTDAANLWAWLRPETKPDDLP